MIKMQIYYFVCLFKTIQCVNNKNEMAIGDCVLAKIFKNNDQSVDDNDINVND